MYEEAVAIPMIVAGPDVPAGSRSNALVSLVDVYASALAAIGIEPTPREQRLPSRSLWSPDAIDATDRTLLSEYHAMGSRSGCYMVRWGQWKYVHYVGHDPELFDLSEDPSETRNLAASHECRAVVAEGLRRLREICHPEATDLRVFREQEELLARYGGAEAIIARGDVLFTPPPGEVTRRMAR